MTTQMELDELKRAVELLSSGALQIIKESKSISKREIEVLKREIKHLEEVLIRIEKGLI
jgi:hypothetical protein